MSHHLKWKVYLQLINHYVFSYDSLEWQKNMLKMDLYMEGKMNAQDVREIRVNSEYTEF